MICRGIAFAKGKVKVEVKGSRTAEENDENSNDRWKVMGPKNQLLTISQVSENLNIPRHTLRFWEKELNGLLVPLRTNGGQRRYSMENLGLLVEIKRCRENGLSLPEIVEKINQGFEGETSQPSKVDLLATRVAAAVKTEVYNFFKTEKDEG
jgi:DNA-binding transcriptional MerR regulator